MHKCLLVRVDGRARTERAMKIGVEFASQLEASVTGLLALRPPQASARRRPGARVGRGWDEQDAPRCVCAQAVWRGSKLPRLH